MMSSMATTWNKRFGFGNSYPQIGHSGTFFATSIAHEGHSIVFIQYVTYHFKDRSTETLNKKRIILIRTLILFSFLCFAQLAEAQVLDFLKSIKAESLSIDFGTREGSFDEIGFNTLSNNDFVGIVIFNTGASALVSE